MKNEDNEDHELKICDWIVSDSFNPAGSNLDILLFTAIQTEQVFADYAIECWN